MKNVFAIGAERDGTHRHAQCVISNRERCSPWNIGLEPCVPVPATRNTRVSKPSIGRARLCRAEEIQAAPRSVALPTMCRVSALFTARLKMQKQEPGRENGG